jgi:CheY-like chemotaxis protein
VGELAQHKLIQHGYQVTHAAGGQAAVDAAEQNRPDLIVLDIMMPNPNGIGVFRQFCSLNNRIGRPDPAVFKEVADGKRE